jgi:hypothetical protein
MSKANQCLLYPAKSNLNWLLDQLQLKCPTNRHVLKVLLCSAFCTSDDFKFKLHVFLEGDYASSKTFIATLVRDMLPISNQVVDEFGLCVPKLSPKAMFYSTKNGHCEGSGKKKVWIPTPMLYANRVAYIDDVTDGLIEMLKDLTNTTGDVPSHLVTNKDNKGTLSMRLDGKPTIWTSKVVGFNNEQLNSRFYRVICEKDVAKIHDMIIRNASCDAKPAPMDEKAIKSFISERIATHCKFNTSVDVYKQLPIPKSSNRNSDFEVSILNAITKINADEVTAGCILTPQAGDILEAIELFQDKRCSITNTWTITERK